MYIHMYATYDTRRLIYDGNFFALGGKNWMTSEVAVQVGCMLTKIRRYEKIADQRKK